MEKDKTISEIKHKSLVSTLSLFFQSGYSAFLGLGANLAVTIILSPAIFGIYITTLSIISVLNYFSDIGLAASLVQKKELLEDDIKTTFSIQQAMILTGVSIGFLFTHIVQGFYKLPDEGVFLYWALLVSFFLSSLKTIPSIFLERKIQFQRIVFVQVVENTVFYLSVIIFALIGFKLTSFTIAVLFRAITGLILIYYLSPWNPKIGISKKSLKTLLSFGLPFQASSFLALFKDDLIILFLGKILGFESLGYIGWAKKWAEAPIRIIMDNISRVLFPVISRIQHEKEKVGKIIEKILFYQTLILSPLLVFMALCMDKVIYIIPKYAKWEPALPLFYIFCLTSFFSSYSSPFMNLFNALGKVKISFSFMIFWTVLTWLFTPLFTGYFGYYGFPISLLIVAFTSLFVSRYAKQIIFFHFLNSIYKPLLSALIMGIILYSFFQTDLPVLPELTGAVLLSVISYYLSLKILFRIHIIEELRALFVK